MAEEQTLNPNLCYNLTYFKDLMKGLRKIDDNIMLQMNTTNIHSEDSCATFFGQLSEAYKKREHTIQYCLKVMDEELAMKQKELHDDPDDYDVRDSIYTTESQRRMIHNELVVEDIVRDRSLKVFREKCRSHRIPKEFKKFLKREI
ncbi:hypothetical protein K493DRAFT_410551 [Basidiobolus meristosporus CBS 931.73]|uniref:Coiled-coil domain-containing protein 58 n=1 Tax=Basidiobolus meristosporus CBS 931.73 TaxID=1314790 RepID=A0A1Y1XVD6_9FUNG|nr:hypothetical protein K493DRAFT_410551 [Basidiobolus meristosporus CBS 931.73]|eukprot:ORX89244.1 hypothetical protein K493DRAFT_410551 [Basidiobolus meristosporus CBS 931.73]